MSADLCNRCRRWHVDEQCPLAPIDQARDPLPSRCSFPSCDCPGESPVCDDYEQTNEDHLLGELVRDSKSVCIVHLVPEPCPTCRAYMAAGL